LQTLVFFILLIPETACLSSASASPLVHSQTVTMDALRTAVQPITHNLPPPIRDLGVSIIGDKCYKALLLDVDIENTECLKLAVSKGLGIGIIAASSIVKVPQILKLVNSKSADGVSFLSYLLETSAYLITLAYNVRNGFPFSTFGETALILGQNVIISVLVLNYSGRASMAAVLVAALAGSVATLFAENLLDMKALSYLQAGAGVLGVASKVPQILAIWQEGGTGQLSAFAVRCFSPAFLFTFPLLLVWSGQALMRSRSSTTLPALFLESSLPSRRSTTSLFCMASSLDLL
jgi:mannose-P-dolichol utilization defect 1